MASAEKILTRRLIGGYRFSSVVLNSQLEAENDLLRKNFTNETITLRPQANVIPRISTRLFINNFATTSQSFESTLFEIQLTFK